MSSDGSLVIVRIWDLWWLFSTTSMLVSRQRMLENGVDIQREAKIVNYEVTGEAEGSTLDLDLFLSLSMECALILFSRMATSQ